MDGLNILKRLGIKTMGQAFSLIYDSFDECDEDDDEDEAGGLYVALAKAIKVHCYKRIKDKAKLKRIELTNKEVDEAGFVLYQMLLKELASDEKYGKLWKTIESQKGKEVA